MCFEKNILFQNFIISHFVEMDDDNDDKTCRQYHWTNSRWKFEILRCVLRRKSSPWTFKPKEVLNESTTDIDEKVVRFCQHWYQSWGHQNNSQIVPCFSQFGVHACTITMTNLSDSNVSWPRLTRCTYLWQLPDNSVEYSARLWCAK